MQQPILGQLAIPEHWPSDREQRADIIVDRTSRTRRQSDAVPESHTVIPADLKDVCDAGFPDDLEIELEPSEISARSPLGRLACA